MSINFLSFSQSGEASQLAVDLKAFTEVNKEIPLAQNDGGEAAFAGVVGQSSSLRKVLELVEIVAATDATVLLLGETGTGKELIAQEIHRRSPRAKRPLVKVNCAALPKELIASELFGYEKGAFTGAIQQRIGRFEAANGGTIFLDEIGELCPEMQIALLRVLQEKEFERVGGNKPIKTDVRIIAATNRDLKHEVTEGRFRMDLYYRLNVFPIRIPPLRERREDIPLLVGYFVQKFAQQMQKQIETIPAAAMKRLIEWDWPGNVRELGNFIERAVILTRGRSLETPLTELRGVRMDEPAQTASEQGQEEIARIVKETINALKGRKSVDDEHNRKQCDEIVRALTESRGRVGGEDGAATRLGINRTTLLSRMKKLGIDPKQFS